MALQTEFKITDIIAIYMLKDWKKILCQR